MPRVEQPKITRNRHIQRFYSVKSAIDTAGYQEFVSKRVDLNKLFATIVRQASQEQDPSKLALIAAIDRSDRVSSTAYSGQFIDYRQVMICPPHICPILDLLFSDDGDMILACAGEVRLPNYRAHEDLTRSLNAHDRRYEIEIAEISMNSDYKRADFRRFYSQQIVVEDKPGKPYLLSIEEPTLKAAERKWRQISKNSEGFQNPSALVEGWAAAAAVLYGSKTPTSNSFAVASMDVCFSNKNMELSQLSTLVDLIEGWLESVSGISLGSLLELSVNIPSVAISGYFRQELIARHARLALARFDVSNFTYGWHPIRALIHILSEGERPFLYLNTADFPTVNLLASWPC